MEFRIADTFSDSLAKLAGKEQTAAKTTAFDLQMKPGMQFHMLDRTKAPDLSLVGVDSDIRVIVHRAVRREDDLGCRLEDGVQCLTRHHRRIRSRNHRQPKMIRRPGADGQRCA